MDIYYCPENKLVPIKHQISIINSKAVSVLFSKRGLSWFKKCRKKLIFNMTESMNESVVVKMSDGFYFKHNSSSIKCTKCQFLISRPCLIVFEKSRFSNTFKIVDFDRACSLPTFLME